MNCNIEIKGNRAYLSGNYPKEFVKKVTSYFVNNYYFSKLYKLGKWDGRRHFFNEKTCSFPAGLVDVVKEELQKNYKECKVSITDYREENIPPSSNRGFDLIGVDFGQGKYDYQIKAAEEAIKKKRGILKLAVNAGKTEISCAITKHLSVPTLFIVPGIDLLYQTRDRFSKRLGIEVEDIGLIGDNNFKLGNWITVGTVDSLLSRIKSEDLVQEDLDKWDLLFIDECHGAGSVTAYKVLDKIPAYWRFGLSATPLDRSDGDTFRLISQTGPIIYEVSNKDLVDRGISVQPVVRLLKINEPVISKKVPWPKVKNLGIVKNPHLNDLIALSVTEYAKEGKLCLVLVDQITQGEEIKSRIKDVRAEFIHGKADSDERKKALNDFSKGNIKVLIGTSIFNQGIDLDCIDVIALAGGGKATIPVIQRIGRGLRSGRGRDKLIVLDVMNFCHKHLIKHSHKRLQLYKKEGCFIIELE